MARVSLARRSLGMLALIALAACARPPQRLAGEFPPLTVADTQAQGITGERVRWGGEIVRTTPADGETCFEIIQQPLDRRARPVPGDATMGRFIACGTGFYDPQVYASRREVTVVGTVEALEPGSIGDSTYQFPRVRSETIYLWAPRAVARAYYADPWPAPYPYWGPYPGWYGSFGVAAWPWPYYWGAGWWGSPYWWGGRGWWGPRYYGGHRWYGGGWRGGGRHGGRQGGGGGRRRAR